MLFTVMTKMIQEVEDEASVINILFNQEAEILTRKILNIIKQIEQFIHDQRLGEDTSEQAREDLFQETVETFTEQIL